ncbi:MAG: SBBP repeat-containing protein [Bacteroidales bacterium]|jgi:gliding motility-associated-like protein
MNKFYAFLLQIFLSCFSLSNFPADAQAPTWVWARNPTGVNNEAFEYAISADLMGNVYVGGSFDSPTITFGSFTLTSPANGNEQLFLVKYDPAGNVVWARSATCTYSNVVNSLATDAAGNIYIAGAYDYSDITFGSVTLVNAGSSDSFLVKYDPNGNVIWARRAGSNGSDGAISVATGASGDIYITGFFDSSSITFGSFTLTNTGNDYDMFVAKYDADGNVIWAKSAGGPYSDYGCGIDVDLSGNVYVTGEFGSLTMTIGPFTLTKQTVNPALASTDLFLAKYDAGGNVLWAKRAGGNESETVNSVSVDNAGNVFLPGNYKSQSITLGSSTFTNIDPQYNNVFLAKYSTDGDIIWAVSAGGPDDDEIASVSSDKYGNAYLAGYSESPSITFGSYTLPNPISPVGNLFVTKYDGNGNALWVKSTLEPSGYPHAGAVDTAGHAYICGSTGSQQLRFDSTTLFFPYTTNGFFGSFTAKLSNYSVNIVHTDPVCYADHNGTATANVTGGTPPFTYLWNTTPPQTTKTATGLQAGIYKVTVTDASGLVTIGYVTINQPALIQTDIQQVICKGDSLLFNGNYYSTPGILYDTMVSVKGCDSIIKLTLAVDPLDTTHLFPSICPGGIYNFYGTPLTTPGIYYHMLTSSHGCDSVISVNLTVNPDYFIVNPQTICDGKAYIIGGNTYTIAGNYLDTLKTVSQCDSVINTQLLVNPSYHYNDQQTICSGQSYVFRGNTYTVTGNYFDPFTTVLGCDSIFQLSLTVNPLPIAWAGNDIRTSYGNPVQLNATGGVSYQWNPPDYLSNPFVSDPVSTPLTTITYVVTVTDSNGCSATDTVKILLDEYIIIFPNAFTPNGDGLNDVFRPKADNICRFTMSVYNRIGQLLFETDNIETGWNGMFRGELCPAGVYVYTATYEFAGSGERKTISGNFTLLR